MDPINVTVTVIVRMRVAGVYYCTISKERTDLTLSGITDIPPTTTPHEYLVNTSYSNCMIQQVVNNIHVVKVVACSTS